jgi:Ala-tRNA(Pro) deacylase
MNDTLDLHPAEVRVLEVMKELDIACTRRTHPAVFTVEQARLYEQNTPGAHCKNLFLRDRKGLRHFLAVFDERRQVDLRKLADQASANGLSFASPERLLRILGLTPGAVGPFGLLHPEAREVVVLMDAGLASAGFVSFHPNVNTATLTFSSADFERYLAWVGNPVVRVD